MAACIWISVLIYLPSEGCSLLVRRCESERRLLEGYRRPEALQGAILAQDGLVIKGAVAQREGQGESRPCTQELVSNILQCRPDRLQSACTLFASRCSIMMMLP